MVSDSHESGSSLAGSFWLRVSGEVSQTTGCGCSHSKGLQDELPISLNMAIDRRALLPHHMGLSMGLLPTWQLASPRARDIEEKGDATLLFMTSSLSHFLPLPLV